MKKKVVIIGGGFGGLNAAKHLGKSGFDVLLIDKTNHHLFQPLLYQVATASLSPGDIAKPIRDILSPYPNVTVFMGEVTHINAQDKTVLIGDIQTVKFDYLIVAIGARHSYFGHPEWETFSPGLKNLKDAVSIRERVLMSFEKAERGIDPVTSERYLKFVIIGGGPTGVELAGAIAEIAQKTLSKNFRRIDPKNAKVYLIEAGPRVLPAFDESLSKRTKKYLEKLGVTVLVDTKVTKVNKEGVEIGDGFIETSNAVWAAGNEAPKLLKELGVELDRQGRVIVNPNLTIPGSDSIFVLGDAAHFKTKKTGLPLPGIAPVAIQQGKYIAKFLKSKKPVVLWPAFRYFDKGMLATVGKSKAIGQIGKLHLLGFSAWLFWSIVHIFMLIGFRNRIAVTLQWVFAYFSNQREIRLVYQTKTEDYRNW